MKWNEDDIEFVISCLDSPEMMAGEKFREWIKIQAHRDLFEMVRTGREAFLHKEDYGHINTEHEYRCFVTRVRKRRLRVLRMWGPCGFCQCVAGILSFVVA